MPEPLRTLARYPALSRHPGWEGERQGSSQQGRSLRSAAGRSVVAEPIDELVMGVPGDARFLAPSADETNDMIERHEVPRVRQRMLDHHVSVFVTSGELHGRISSQHDV